MRAWLACQVPMKAPKSLRPGCAGSPSGHATNPFSVAALGPGLCERSGIVRHAARKRLETAKRPARNRIARSPNRRRLQPAERVPGGVVARDGLTRHIADELPSVGESVADFILRKATRTDPARLVAADETEQQ